MESTSLMRPTSINPHVTRTRVPLSDIFGVYWQSRYEMGHGGKGCFYTESENEFLAWLDHLPFEYCGTVEEYNT